jgi:hypothetical protein
MAGKIIPGAEKLRGENLFPEKEQGFFHLSVQYGKQFFGGKQSFL